MKIDSLSDSDLYFGLIAIKKGYIKTGEANEALKIQKREDAEGLIHREIGAILVGQGQMTIEQVKDVLEEQWGKKQIYKKESTSL